MKNILAELAADTGSPKPDGDLTTWAAQGVLLLNTVLTVPLNHANGHKGWGWEPLVTQILNVTATDGPRAFVLWARPAQELAAQKLTAQKLNAQIPRANHVFPTAPHPSPLLAHRGFFGLRPFSQIDHWLETCNQPPINGSA